MLSFVALHLFGIIPAAYPCENGQVLEFEPSRSKR